MEPLATSTKCNAQVLTCVCALAREGGEEHSNEHWVIVPWKSKVVRCNVKQMWESSW